MTLSIINVDLTKKFIVSLSDGKEQSLLNGYHILESYQILPKKIDYLSKISNVKRKIKIMNI